MKQILTAILVIVTGIAMAQKRYQPTPADYQHKLSISLNVSVGQLNNYFIVLQNGGLQGIANSDKLHGNEITAYTKDYITVTDSLNNAALNVLNVWYKVSEAKWAADTLKAKGKRP